MKTSLTLLACAALSAAAQAQSISTTQHGDTTVLRIDNPTRYLLLPVEEAQDESRVLLNTNSAADTWMDVRLAQNKIDYYVPFSLPQGKIAEIRILNLRPDALALTSRGMKLSNEWNVSNTDLYRPIYHHTPSYGWMNDPNGMFYKDGVYHLSYQYNPYGSRWGNMHWGHAISRDLIHWEEVEPTLARDTLGHIFSGSAVVDKENTAGFGKDAIVAFYTSADLKIERQIQCMAYSTDGGYHFTKYVGNPVVTPFDGLKNFRDPKVFWHAPTKTWCMIVSADKEMRLYHSTNLRDWNYVSAFGQGYGMQPNQFECPDIVELPVDGKKKNKKWAFIVNINPGCLFGGSATEYFIGDFNGKKFTPDTDPKVYKYLDWGKDQYATVTFSNTGNRALCIGWMSNWQYANVTPIKQYRGANTLPRELSLFSQNGNIYMAAAPAEEVKLLRKQTIALPDMAIENSRDVAIAPNTDGAFEIEMTITPGETKKSGFVLFNDKGEKVDIYLDMSEGKLVMDRTESGLTEFGTLAQPHEIEANYDATVHKGPKATFRESNSLNYVNDFALATWAPLNLCKGKHYKLRVFVDKCSIEIFVDGGRIAMTNLVFPTAPYKFAKFYAEGGKAKFKQLKTYALGL